MKIYRFDPKGIHLAEITGIGEIEKDLPKDWFGFSNFVMRLPRSRESREIDVAIVTHDRIILVDLKDWRGYIENRDNYWFQNGEQRDRSAALKINENAQKLKELLKLAPKIPAIPWVEGLVVFTHQEGNFSGLSDVDKQRCLSLSKFLKLADEKRYDDFFKPSYQYSRKNPLNEKETRSVILNFFKENRYFEPRESKFAGYRLIGSSTFQHPKEIYDEYFCEFENDKNHTALLRIWDFSKLSAEFSAEDVRRSIANREYSVHGYIKVQCPELYRDGILNSKDSDRSFSMRFWQLFEVGRDLKRINSYVNIHSESLTLQRRLELTSLFLARIAELHRIKIAHRDLDGDSVWIEPSSRIILSRFSASYYPEHATIGDKRVKLLAAGTRLPEDAELVNPGTAFQQDVFLAAVVCWKILTGEDELPGDENIPIWQSGNMRDNLDLPNDLEPWFDRCLTHEPSKRFSDCIEAFDAYRKVASHHEPVDFSSCLTRHTRDDIDLFLDYPITKLIQKGPPRIYVSGEGDTAILVKHWPDFFLGIRRQSAASLYTFLSITEEIQAHLNPWVPEIITACLCTDGLILVQKYIDVSNLKDTNLAFWDTETAIYFIKHLLQAVEYLHENKITHGDLKPDNILVVKEDKYPKPILVDFPDFSPPDAGQRMTMAYCPELGSEDPAKRDRFAVYKISVEIFERIGGSGKDNLAQRLLKEAMVQLKDGTASMTLLPLRAVLEQSHRTTMPSIEINIGFPQCHENADLIADNGIFYARVEINERKIYIVGMDQKIQIILPSDPKSSEITAARIWTASTEDVAYANRQGVAFRGRVSVYKNRNPKIQGFQELINIPEIAQFFSKPISPEIVDLNEKDKLIDQNETANLNINSVRFEGFKVERFWREVIDAEADLLPEILIIDKVSHDNQVLIVSCEEQETSELDFEGDKTIDVIREGKKIGELDTSLSTSGLIALRNVKRPLLITPGTRLRFQERGNLNSFRCRSKAVDRILRSASEIRELIEYFNPSANINPRQWSRLPSEEIIARYDLNNQQKQAFRHLWTYGPVGLLQGPPGTGKTKFISSFIHYALNEGGMRNVLLLSQSHEAVNNAAEKVLERAHEFGNPIDLLRIGQQGKVSKPLLPYHSDLVQERYRELFRAEMKGRIAIVGKQLGLPAIYIAEAFELEATIGQLVHQIINRESDLRLSGEHDLDLESTKRKLRTLRESYESYLNDFDLDFDLEPSEVMDVLRRRLRQQYSIHDISATEKLRHCYKIAEEWVAVLGVRQRRNLEEFLARSRSLVCGTCVGIGRPGLQIENTSFDLVVIDEAARCDPGELAVGMQSGCRILLVGDHKQLPPLYDLKLIDEIRKRLGIVLPSDVKKSDFERAFLSPYGQQIGQTLKVQYRMAPKIGDLISKCFYPEEGLETGRGDPPSYYNRHLPPPLDHELLWADTSTLGRVSHENKAGTSYRNRVEADTIVGILKKISNSKEFIEELKQNLNKDEFGIGIICMYSAQKFLMRDRIAATVWPDNFDPQQLVNTDTVDGYQGKENRIIILSLVRNNSWGAKGHVKEKNRINVALSRAMERLIIVGSGAVFSQQSENNHLAKVWQHLKSDDRIVNAELFTQEN